MATAAKRIIAAAFLLFIRREMTGLSSLSLEKQKFNPFELSIGVVVFVFRLVDLLLVDSFEDFTSSAVVSTALAAAFLAWDSVMIRVM